MTIEFRPIGIIHTPFKEPAGMPIQPVGAVGIEGEIEVFPEFADGLQDLDGFSHIILIYYFHRSKGFKLRIVPFMDTVSRGVFATRAPKRPNPIGISIVKLLGVNGSRVRIAEVDVLDGTPLLDIKPYVPAFDARDSAKAGWIEKTGRDVKAQRSDHRFV